MNVDVSFFRRHFAASISILTGRNVSTVGEFGTYILQKEIPILVAHENSTLKQYVIHSFCALYSLNECSIGFKTFIGLCIDACLSCCCKQLRHFEDYFVTVNRADYHGNKWRWSDFRLS